MPKTILCNDWADTMTLNWKPVVLSLLQHLEAQDLVPCVVRYGDERIFDWSDDTDERREEILEELCAVDEVTLVCELGSYLVHLFLVFGNDPEELVADWVCTHDDPLEQRVIAALDAFDDDWAGKPCPTQA